LPNKASVLPPNHLVHDAGVALDDADDLGAHVLVLIVRDWDAGMAVMDKAHGQIDALKEAFSVNTAKDKAALVKGFGTLGAGAYAH
jgi:hypothetical protein